MINSKKIGFFLGPITFLLVLLFFNPSDLSQSSNAVLASILWIAIWWISEAAPIAVTSLLPIILFPLTGGMELSNTTASFGHKLIFLIMGGFIISIAIEKWNLHKRIAINLIYVIGTDLKKIILGFMVATAFLSMWISNTATSVMMVPIGIIIVKHLMENNKNTEKNNLTFPKALMLSIAYSASIGGISTLIGTPTNMVMAGVISDTYNYEISFFDWFIFGFPLSLFLLIVSWYFLTRIAFTFPKNSFTEGRDKIYQMKKKLGSISYEQKIVSIVFGSAAICWILRTFLLQRIFPKIDDTIIAVFFAIILFILNSKNKNEKILKWEDVLKLPWGILLLMGSGMAIARAVETSGLAIWIGNQMGNLGYFDFFIIIILLVSLVNFLTEVTSNMATISLFLPILAAVSFKLDLHPFILMVSATLAASCAFMLPVATPPNAIVFSSGYLNISDMVKKGFLLNIISILIISLFVYFLLPFLWDLIPNKFPQGLLNK